jgi:hypothetical protein
MLELHRDFSEYSSILSLFVQFTVELIYSGSQYLSFRKSLRFLDWRFDWLGPGRLQEIIQEGARSFQPTDERVSTGHMPAMEACKISDGGQLNSGITEQFLD